MPSYTSTCYCTCIYDMYTCSTCISLYSSVNGSIITFFCLVPQVSHLLTNHLSRAMDRLVVSEGGASESLQDALSLLLGLAKSQMGRAILSQPACVSKLLLLLTDQRQASLFMRFITGLLCCWLVCCANVVYKLQIPVCRYTCMYVHCT